MNDHSWTLQHLPWYTNGTLVGDEYGRAHRHIGECLLCQQEHLNLQKINHAISQPISFAGDAASALSEINSQIAEYSPSHSTVWYGSIWERLKQLTIRTPPIVRAALVVQTAVVAALLFALPIGLSPVSTQNNPYRTLSGGQNTQGDIRVLFAPDIRLEQQQTLLEEIDARIVDGPSARGVYTLVINQDQTTQAVEILQSSTLVDFAQPIMPASDADQ